VIRVLVADDSPSFRAVLRAILEAAPEIEVVAEAVDGDEAVRLTARLRPDVVTMDVRMPGKDGLSAIAEIMERAPTPVVVVSAEIGPENQQVSFRALALGAIEVLRKPSSVEPGVFEADADAIRTAVRAMHGLKLVTRHPRSRGSPGGPAAAPSRAAHPALTPPAVLPALTPSRPLARADLSSGPAPRLPVRAVGLVASTGGPPALARLLAGLPGDFPASILVVQHIASGFEAGLVQWLARETALRVKLAEHGEPLRPGTVYLAGQGRHLTALVGTAFLDDGPPVRGFRPSGTVLLASLAREFGATAAGVILTGMGDDGVAGLVALGERGGATLAQGPASAVVFGMPREAIERGAARALELDELAPALVRLAQGTRGSPR
jgi:two-component system chemotaxis response regulator CheB